MHEIEDLVERKRLEKQKITLENQIGENTVILSKLFTEFEQMIEMAVEDSSKIQSCKDIKEKMIPYEMEIAALQEQVAAIENEINGGHIPEGDGQNV